MNKLKATQRTWNMLDSSRYSTFLESLNINIISVFIALNTNVLSLVEQFNDRLTAIKAVMDSMNKE